MVGARGEQIIEAGTLGEVRVLFTNRAIAEAEAQIGKSIIEVSQGYADGRSGMREIAHLLRAGMEAARRDAHTGGRPVSLPQAYEVLDQVGFAGVAEAVMLAVATVLSYGTDAEEEAGYPNP